jgi:hypothetical protein
MKNMVMGMSEKTASAKKFGKCVICGERVHSTHEFITAEEGYCHRTCI